MSSKINILAIASPNSRWIHRLIPYFLGLTTLIAIISLFLVGTNLSTLSEVLVGTQPPKRPSGHHFRNLFSPKHWAEPLRTIVALAIVVIAVVLWVISLQWIDVRNMNDLGLVSILPLPSFIALASITLGFCLTLAALERTRSPVLLVYLLALIFMLYATPALVEEAPRFPATYWLAGHTDYILKNGAVDPFFDAYFNWPGFFVLTGLLTKITGLNSVLAFAPWVSLVYNLMYIAPLYLLFATATTDRRTIWLGMWFFFTTDWVWQDYFDPQGLNFFFYLVIMVIVLKGFKTTRALREQADLSGVLSAHPTLHKTRGLRGFIDIVFTWCTAWCLVWTRNAWARFKGYRPTQLWKHRRDFPKALRGMQRWAALSNPPSTSEQQRKRIALLIALIGIFALSVFSHPITPFFIILSISALVLSGRVTPRWLPLLLMLILVGWDFTAATPYLGGHLKEDLAAFGNIQVVTSSNVTNRLAVGDPQHHFVSQVRVWATAAIWGLAALGMLLRWRPNAVWYRGEAALGKGSLFSYDLTFTLLIIAPVLLVVAQPYGGEMAMRYYLFSLPIVSFFAAAGFRSRIIMVRRPSYRFMAATRPIRALAITAACLLLLTGFMFARYGNENADYVTYNELNAVTYLYGVAPQHSLLLQAWTGTPWRYQNLVNYTYSPLDSDEIQAAAIQKHDIDNIVKVASNPKYPATYIIFSRSQKVQAEMFFGVPPSAFDTVSSELVASGKFVVVYSNSDAQILKYVGTHHVIPPPPPPLAGKSPKGVS